MAATTLSLVLLLLAGSMGDFQIKKLSSYSVSNTLVAILISILVQIYDLVSKGKQAELLSNESIVLVKGGLALMAWSFSTLSLNALKYLSVLQHGDKSCKETQVSMLARMTFAWFNSIISIGVEKHLDLNDLDVLGDSDCATNILLDFESKKSPGKLVWNLYALTKYHVWLQSFWALVTSILSYTGPYFLREILLYVENYTKGTATESDTRMALLYCIGIFVFNMLRSLADGQMYFIGRRIGLRVRAVIISLVYQKSLKRTKVPHLDIGQSNSSDSGMIVNLMAVDAVKILEVSCYMMYLWCTPLQAIICIGFLVYVAGAPGLVGVSIMVIMVPVGAKIGAMITRYQRKLMEATDNRMTGIDELLQGIRIVKFFAWEDNFLKKIRDLRGEELVALWRYMLTVALSRIIWQITPVLVSFLTFSTMTFAAGKDLDATTAFTALTLFNALRGPLNTFPDTIVKISEAIVSLRRVENYLNTEEVEATITTHPVSKDAAFQVSVDPESVFSWTESFKLQCSNVKFVPQGLTIIEGPTGAGKSSLLLALLGELSSEGGCVRLGIADSMSEHVPIAFASQQVWLQNATIKENILFGSFLDPERYDETIKCCALSRDLANLEGGDQTEVGEKGVNLSGGQKARISLARAVYSSSPIVLLDDPLSAVDAPTAKYLFKHCIRGKLLQGRTRILVTHNTALCSPFADHTIYIDHGQIQENVPTMELPSATESEPVESATLAILEASSSVEDIYAGKHTSTTVKRSTEDESQCKGSVSAHVYKAYIRAAGGVLFAFLLMFTYSTAQALVIGNDWWLKTWADAYIQKPIVYLNSLLMPSITALEGTHPAHNLVFSMVPPSTRTSIDLMFYLRIYAVLAVLTILVLVARVLVVATGSLKASEYIHAKLLKRLICAPVRFFEKTPTGRILNRLGKDMKDIDQDVAFYAGDFLSNCVMAFGVVLLIVCVTPLTIVGMIPIGLSYIFVALRYIRSSRELKRLDSVTRSPIYSHFGETLSGAPIIRAYSAQGRFIDEIHKRIDKNHTAFFYLWVSNRWLGIRVDFIGSMVALTSCLAVLFALHFAGGINPGVAGISISYALSFSDALLWLVRMHALMEMEMNAVERVDEYLQIEQEPLESPPGQELAHNWPTQGAIQFKGLTLRYAADSDPVLNNVSFNVLPGERVGIVGRTGAGKTTLSLALFRFMEFDSGTILIDGIDISKIGLTDLRSRLTVIPQDPVLFSGTLRSNLDPFDTHPDSALWDALVHSSFLESMQRPANGQVSSVKLDMSISEGGKNLSQGQRQLLCLARALLRKSRVVVLDEATASVDYSTDVKIQDTIRNELGKCTLLCIAHRLRTVMDYDKILVLDKGCLMQFGSPLTLMDTRDGIFAKMCEETGEFQELRKLALHS